MRTREKIFFKIKVDKRTIISALIAIISGVGLLFISKGNVNIPVIAAKIALLGIICVGAVFVFTVGAFGISLGASTLLSTVCGGAALYYSNSFVFALCVCICVSTLGCVLSALLSYTFSLPPYVTATVMLTFFVSAARAILDAFGGEIVLNTKPWDIYKMSTLASVSFLIFFIVCALLYNIFPLGKKQKKLGKNREIANLCGIDTRIYATLGYLMAGISVGICAFFVLCNSESVTRTQVSDLGFNIIFAVVLGLVFLIGGENNKLVYALFGSVSAIFISEIFAIVLAKSSLNAQLSQIFRSFILLGVLIASKNAKEDNSR